MLIKLHEKCWVNPINVAAVIRGQLSVAVKLTNGRAHNIESREGVSKVPALFGRICDELKKHVDMIMLNEARDATAVNVDHVLSMAATNPGVTINMQGDWTIILPCGPSTQVGKIAALAGALERFK